MSHPLFGPEVRQMLADDDSEQMRTFCETLHPATIAEVLDEFDLEQVWRILSHASIRDQATIFGYFPIDKQVEMAEGAGQPQMARLIEQMSHDDRVDLLRRLPPRVADGLLRLVDEADRKDIKTMMAFKEGTVGALMTTDYAWLPVNLRAGEAIDRLRLQAPNSETIYYIYVLDEASRRLLGVVSLRDLILASRQTPIREIMETDPVTLKTGDDRDRAAQELARFDLLALPVVDDDTRLVGIVTHDDVIDVVVEEATEAVHKMGGVGNIGEDYLEANFYRLWRTRAFWLSLLFVAELLTFYAMSAFEDEIAKLVVLSLFVPLCISTGGNSGSQATTLITRAMALGQLSPRDWVRVLRRELLMGVFLGVTLGFIGYVRGLSTSEAVRGGGKDRDNAFIIRVPADSSVETQGDRLQFPPGATELVPLEQASTVLLPPGKSPLISESGGERVYELPAGSEVRTHPVNRTGLGLVIGLSVLGICLWGTVIGAMLPLVFRQLGFDPGIASGPFVATFVDVSGILIYFSIARVFLLS